MPETNRQVIRGDVFERNVQALASPASKGGIMNPDNYKSYVVNIRPKRWKERFWIGKIDNFENAQFIADAVYHYTGRPAFHLKRANFKFPPLQCVGTSAPLTDREMCLKYVSSIAEGAQYKVQRADFKSSVTKLALEEVKSDEVQRVLRQIRAESGSAAIPIEGVTGNDGDEGAQACHPTPMEVDEHSEKATHLSQLVASSHDGTEVVDRNVEGGDVHIPSFDINGPGFTLQSDLTPVVDFSRDAEAYLGSFQDSDSEDYLESLNYDKEDFCSATGDPEKSSFYPSLCPSAMENFKANFFAMGDAGIDWEDASWKSAG